ncbi:MAG: diguanylate cyclase [Spirochaetales bacterium]|nr:diguanylate cyclase [Spirochaetales bacterium]
MKKPIIVVCFIWALLIAGSLTLSINTAENRQNDIYLFSARSFFDQVVITRAWNSLHGGVYVPVTEATLPNPYLEDDLRDIKVNEELILTKLNPAYMTRLISEITEKHDGVKFHITSLNPLNPNNMPTDREREALLRFENGESETGKVISEDGDSSYFYMAPLNTDLSCLKCHAKQGYIEDDIRGGISLTIPIDKKIVWSGITAGHIMLFFMGLAGIIISGTALSRAYLAIKRQAIFDGLTGLHNRRSFSQQIVTEFGISRRKRYPLSIIMIDIDFFKQYNDTYGHKAGDECLIEVASTIRQTLKRPADYCARYGGEEFIVILPDTAPSGAEIIAENLRKNIVQLKIPHEKSEIGRVSISLGVATATVLSQVNHDQLVNDADKALYSAKAQGRNRVEVFSEKNEQ